MSSDNHFSGGGRPLPERRRLINQLSHGARKIIEDIEASIDISVLNAEQIKTMENARRFSNALFKPNLLETKSLEQLNALAHEITVYGEEITFLAAKSNARDNDREGK